jgi:glutathione S-transferase
VHPFPAAHRNLSGYLERLVTRPSVARVLREARPYFEMFPLKHDIPSRFLHD